MKEGERERKSRRYETTRATHTEGPRRESETKSRERGKKEREGEREKERANSWCAEVCGATSRSNSGESEVARGSSFNSSRRCNVTREKRRRACDDAHALGVRSPVRPPLPPPRPPGATGAKCRSAAVSPPRSFRALSFSPPSRPLVLRFSPSFSLSPLVRTRVRSVQCDQCDVIRSRSRIVLRCARCANRIGVPRVRHCEKDCQECLTNFFPSSWLSYGTNADTFTVTVTVTARSRVEKEREGERERERRIDKEKKRGPPGRAERRGKSDFRVCF